MKRLIFILLIILSLSAKSQQGNFYWSYNQNFRPTSTTTYLYAIVVNNSADAGKTIGFFGYTFPSFSSGGCISYPSVTLQSTNPSYFYSFTWVAGSSYCPNIGEQLYMVIQNNSSVGKPFNPSLGHSLRYLITQTEYTSSDLATILTSSSIITPVLYPVDSSECFGNVYGTYRANFTFTVSPTANNYVYMIFDFRE